MPIETAEEMALAKRAELQTKYEAAKERITMFKHRPEAVNETRLIALVLENAIAALDEVIRAIRAERTPFHAMERRLADSIEGGIEAGIELIKARAYEQGRRDALRGVQGACLFEMGRLEEKQRKYGGASWDWEGCPEDMRAYDVLCEVAEFAEEAAMTPEDRRERGRR